MIQHPPRGPAWLSWLFVALWWGVIYYTVPVSRDIREWMVETVTETHWVYRTFGFKGRETFTLIVYAFAALVSLTGLVVLLRNRHRLRWSQWPWVIGVTAFLAWNAARLGRRSPEEAIHFIEYGVLSVLAFRALAHRVRDTSVYLSALILAALAGTGDEMIQWLNPSRQWDFADIGMNTQAALAGIAFLWGGLRPDYIAGAWTRAGARTAAALASAWSLVLIFCYGNTPGFIQKYAPRVSFVKPYSKNWEEMVEYGHAIVHPDGPRFKSRLPLAAFQSMDRARSAEAAAILQGEDPQHNEQYKAFLEQKYPSYRDPFLYEMRVHLFRRDRYMLKFMQAFNDLKAWGAIAVGEERILREFFPRLHAAGAPAPAGEIERAQTLAFVNEYVSEIATLVDTNGWTGRLVKGDLSSASRFAPATLRDQEAKEAAGDLSGLWIPEDWGPSQVKKRLAGLADQPVRQEAAAHRTLRDGQLFRIRELLAAQKTLDERDRMVRQAEWAYRENQILELLAPETLKAMQALPQSSVYSTLPRHFSEAWKQSLRASFDPALPYFSPVGESLVTRFGYGQIVAILLFGPALLWGIAWTRKPAPRQLP